MPEPRKRNRAITLGDVARRSRVSPATVSRVLNDYPHVRPKLRERVQHVIAALGYRPDYVARSLALRETRMLGLVVADITNPFFAQTARVIVERARAHGYNVILCDTGNDPQLEREYVEILRQRRADGIILGSVFLDDPVADDLVTAGYPCLMYDRRLRSGRGSYVVLDNFRAGSELTRHLLGLGHRRVGFIGSLPWLWTAAERLRGYRAALRAAGIRWDPGVTRLGAFNAELARQGTGELLKLRFRPTAIVAGSDVIALGVIQGAGDAGLRVPEDLAVVGIDDVEIAAHRRLELTTMAQPKEEMASLAVEGLLDFIRDPERVARRPYRKVLSPTLVVRGSCGALLHERPAGGKAGATTGGQGAGSRPMGRRGRAAGAR